MSDLMERLAAVEHERWAGWMRHLFSKCVRVVYQGGERVVMEIPHWAVERWTRQMETPYDGLSEEEKESDRREVRSTLAVLEQISLTDDELAAAISEAGWVLNGKGAVREFALLARAVERRLVQKIKNA